MILWCIIYSGTKVEAKGWASPAVCGQVPDKAPPGPGPTSAARRQGDPAPASLHLRPPGPGGSCSSCRSVPAPSSRTSLSSDELRDAVPQHRQQALRVPLQDPASHLRSTPSRNTVSSYPHPHTQPAEHYLGRDTSSQYVYVKGMHDLLKTKQETTQKSRPQDTTLLMSQQGKAILRNCLRRRNVK